MEKEKLYVVRLYDGFDHLWMDVTGALPYDEAHKILMEKTKDGTKNTSYDDIDYYAMFPDGTMMLFSVENRRGGVI